jgi:hypothetical protein
MTQSDELRKAGVDIYLGAVNIDRAAATKRIAGDLNKAKNDARVDAIVARGDRDMAALRDAEQSARLAQMSRRLDGIQAADDAAKAKRAAADRFFEKARQS